MMGVGLMSICVLGASSSFEILAKGKRSIATNSELRDLMNEIQRILYSPIACTAALNPKHLTPGTMPASPNDPYPVLLDLPRVNPDFTLSSASLLSQGGSYGPLKITSAKVFRKQKLSINHYLLGYEVKVEKGGNSTGYNELVASIDFSAVVDGAGTLVECTAPDSSDKVDYVENVACALGTDYVWDPNLKQCVYKYIVQLVSGTSDSVSPTCPSGWIPMTSSTCTVTGAGSYPDLPTHCASNSFPGPNPTHTNCLLFDITVFDPVAQVCNCYYANDYSKIGTEKCTISCGQLKTF